jgi:hypothetical protein
VRWKRYGDDFLDLVITAGFVGRLLSSAAIAKFLDAHHPKVLKEFSAIVQAVSLDQSAAAA